MLTSKGKDQEEKIQEVCKEINYQNLIVLIAVGDYVVNKAKNIKEITKKWGLSFSTVQQAMSCKRNIVLVVGNMPSRRRWQRNRKNPPRRVSA